MQAPTDVAEAVAAPLARFDFDEIFRSDYERIARRIARIIHDPARAEDLALEAFWKLWRRPQAHGANAGGWLHRTAVRLALDELRRCARRARYEPLLMWRRRSPPTPDDLFSSAQEQGRVRAVLAAMAPRQAEMLLLRGDGVRYDELAAALSINPRSVGTLLSRAKAAFRQEYVRRYGEQ